jgi:catechol 2,3-dioxygenase-like lactoylglutathione lyase family enzyme
MVQIDHLDLNVAQLRRSEKFYDKLGEKLGFKKQLSSEDMVAYTDGRFGLYLLPSDAGHKFKPNNVGLNHLAFKAESRGEVDAFFAFLKAEGWAEEPPRESVEYPEGYYSVFFRDPDHILLELAWCPRR